MRLLLALALVLGGAVAQDLTGTYTGTTGIGPVDVALDQAGTSLRGTLRGSGIEFVLDGYAEQGFGSGYASSRDGTVGFEAYLHDDTLGLYLFEFDEEGDVIVESAIELILTRQASSERATPFARPQPFPPAAAASPPDPLVGTFRDDRLTLVVRSGRTGYEAEVESGGLTYALDVDSGGNALEGRFLSGGQTYTFTAMPDGDAMVFVTAGTTYRLTRVVDPFAAPPDPFPPAPAQRPEGQATQGPIATGRYATLTQDAALAFIDAVEFVLDQLGYPQRFSDTERRALVQEIAAFFPSSTQQDQLVLSDARAIWSRAQANWSTASEREQREFALGILILAFGAETVESWIGPSGSGGGRALGGRGGDLGCSTFEECTSRFVDERTLNDTRAAQGCWAAAGCESYDGSTGTFTYGDYD
jgi:hypothetical protein